MKHRQLLVVVLAFAGVVATAVPTAVRAQSDGDAENKQDEPTAEEKEEFAEFVQAAKEEYTAGNFRQAIPFLEKAYEVIPKPALLYRMARAWERAGEPKKALKHYERFLEEKPKTDRRGAVEKKIAELEADIEGASKATVKVESTPSGAKVFVRPPGAESTESEPRGTTPLEMTTKPGTMKVTLEKEGYRARTRKLQVEGGETQTYSFELREAGAKASASTDTSEGGGGSGGMGAGATVGLVVGSIGVVGGGTFYGLGLHCSGVSDGKKNCTRGLYNASVVSSYVGGGLGVLGLGTAAIFWATRGGEGRASTSHDRSPSVRIRLTPRSVGVSGRF